MHRNNHGVRLEKVTRLLGHSNLNTALDYSISIQAALAPAVKVLLD